MEVLSDEEVTEREALQERDELIDKGYYDESPEATGVCDLCLGVKDGDHLTLCIGCAAYDEWYVEHFGAWS